MLRATSEELKYVVAVYLWDRLPEHITEPRDISPKAIWLRPVLEGLKIKELELRITSLYGAVVQDLEINPDFFKKPEEGYYEYEGVNVVAPLLNVMYLVHVLYRALSKKTKTTTQALRDIRQIKQIFGNIGKRVIKSQVSALHAEKYDNFFMVSYGLPFVLWCSISLLEEERFYTDIVDLTEIQNDYNAYCERGHINVVLSRDFKTFNNKIGCIFVEIYNTMENYIHKTAYNEYDTTCFNEDFLKIIRMHMLAIMSLALNFSKLPNSKRQRCS